MARKSCRSSSSSSTSSFSSLSSVFMCGSLTRPTTIPPSLNRQNSHTIRQESTSPSGGATFLLSKMASASGCYRGSPRSTPGSTPRSSPRSSPPASPRQEAVGVQWDVVSRRLSDNRLEGYVSFPDFDQLCEPSQEDSTNSESLSHDD